MASGLFAVLGLACGGSSSTGPSATTSTTTTVPASGPAVTLSPTVLAFTAPAPGTPSVSQTSTLTNSGTETLVITSVVASGNFVETDNCVTSLVAGASCSITVTFVPLTIGSTGAVTITDNASTSPQTLTLTGPTVTPPADQLSPTSLTFGSQRVGTTSAAQNVTLTNPLNGLSAPLTITNIVVIGDFAITNRTCGSSLPAGSSCTISIAFSPTAPGPLTGLVRVFDNAPVSQQGVTLSGTGQ